MNLSQFEQPIGHWGGSNGGPCQARDNWREIVSPVEAIFEFGEVARNVLAVDGTIGPVIAALMLPSAVLTHLNAGVRAAFGPDPVLTTWCAHPASATLPKHWRPSLTTEQFGSRLRLANPEIAVAQKLVTRRSLRRTGFPSAVVSTAATNGV
jgi:hypothetical protein